MAVPAVLGAMLNRLVGTARDDIAAKCGGQRSMPASRGAKMTALFIPFPFNPAGRRMRRL
jgi:hypothetical protein